ncbi:hypothetical protein R5W23_005231 [Gemmata sp. JC673]|uniref:Uncharacterized protein n=1 Tax=Gemmata algarum TaxID=2975278 RepID=A0ABU5F8M8_9BACT|nr:hypothetical protein [Gemmata algarum]MDY3563615.1 hypothetical protein [Gemmata algarum]
MAAQVAFLVVRGSLTPYGYGLLSLSEDEHFQPLEADDRGRVWVPEVVFPTRAAAERERERRELAAHELLNPFWLGPVDYLSYCTEEGVRERVREFGITPPEPVRDPSRCDGDLSDWATWWDAESATWSDEQRADVWALLDKVRLFEVLEVELE